MDIFSQFHHNPPKFKEKALPLSKNSRITLYPLTIIKMIWSRLKIVNMVYTPLKNEEPPPSLDVLTPSPKTKIVRSAHICKSKRHPVWIGPFTYNFLTPFQLRGHEDTFIWDIRNFAVGFILVLFSWLQEMKSKWVKKILWDMVPQKSRSTLQ